MSPSPQGFGAHFESSERTTRPPAGEEVVISGISGLFPSSCNTTEFSENLYNHVDMVTENDLNFQHPEAPRHFGQISGRNKFDAQFFKINHSNATSMEPISGKLLEQAYMAIYDAGINPIELKGKRVGVFIGATYSDTSNVAMFLKKLKSHHILSGCAKSMFSNRISYWLDAKAPSYTVDCSYASSMVCFEHAYNSIMKGECEAAVVGAGNICQLPELGINLRNAGIVTLDGKSKCFDKNGDGTVRAEAINCIFLQKAKDAKRIYAEICYAKTTFDLKDNPDFRPILKPELMEQFLKQFYTDANIDPTVIDYIEANGAAIAEADANELKAIANVFTKGKNTPLKVGSVISNMGHSEAASGVCAITKMCIAYHEGKLPGNLHYSEPVDVPELKEGRLQVVQDNVSFDRGYTAINQFLWNGINCHVLLKGHFKEKNTSKYQTALPRLVLVSGRDENCVNKILHTLESQTMDPEVIGMLHNIYRIDTPGHTCRGYAILDSNKNNETVKIAHSVEYFPGTRKPLWLVFSGMGSQWPGMAAELMKVPAFASVVQRCHDVLKPFNVDLIKILTNPDENIFDEILNCFIGITAVQIGLSYVLKKIGVNPDYIIGHSQGEMGCAYWDGCLTPEETILAAYSRGIVSTTTTFIKGAMVAVGLGYKDILPLCPPDIDVACHNSKDSATLSGPADSIKKFVEELTAKGIFAREVASSNIPFHSRYIQSAGPEFSSKLRTFLKEPKLRSEKWICTSVPQDRWQEDLAKYSSVEYHTNNLMSPVYFEEAAQLIPDNAVVVEVAPHGLLQAILKRSHPQCTHIPLTKRGQVEQIKFLFEAIGKLYQEGFNFNIDVLYPKIEFPVSTETQMISNFVEWEHSEDYSGYLQRNEQIIKTPKREFIMSKHDHQFNYFSGFVRDGKNVFPESAILFLIWETLALYKDVHYKDLSAILQNVQFYEEALISPDENLKLYFNINKGNNYFEVTQNDVILVNGYISEVTKPTFCNLKEQDNEGNSEVTLTSEDIYKHFHAKGMTYRSKFQSIISTNFERTTAKVNFSENWITYIDSLIQLNILAKDLDGIAVPKMIERLTINMDDFKKGESLEVDKMAYYNAKFYKTYNVARCAGIELKNVIFDYKPFTNQEPEFVQSLEFVPHFVEEEIDFMKAINVNLQIVADNISGDMISVTEVVRDSKSSLRKTLEAVADHIPNIYLNVNTIDVKNVNKDIEYNTNLIIMLDASGNTKIMKDVLDNFNRDAFLLTYNPIDHSKDFDIVSSMTVEGKQLVLSKPINQDLYKDVRFINILDENQFAWVSNVKSELQTSKRIVLISERQPQCGLFGLVKNLRREAPYRIGLVVIDDYCNLAPLFDENKTVFKEQLRKNLTFNVFQKGQWGSFYYINHEKPINVQNFKLIRHGDMESLKWIEVSDELGSTDEVQVCYAGLSIRDSQRAIGIIKNNQNWFGFDFSGLDSQGNRVMGLTSGGTVTSLLKVDRDLLWPVPNTWSLEDAATVPLPYVHAYYCLVIKGQLQKGQSVFINGGTGALGQAVISIALSLSCDVFTCVRDVKKKHFLLKLFPQLKEENVTFSNENDIYTMVKLNTKGRGCDIVVNSANGKLREATMKCCAHLGIFMNVNDYDYNKNEPFGMSFVAAEKSYQAVNLTSLFELENSKDRKMLQNIVAEGIIKGTIRPLSRVVYPTTEVRRAFQLVSSNKHRGRVLIKIEKSEALTQRLGVIPRYSLNSNGTYAVICAKPELGIELANRLVQKGATRLILHFKSKNLPGFVHMKLSSWQSLGVKVKISSETLDKVDICNGFIKEANELGRLQGIFITQESSPCKECWNQEDFVKRYKEVTQVVANLDLLSRNNCPELRYFVVVSCSSQDAVDEYNTSIVEKICRDRQKSGLFGLSLKIEVLDEVHSQIKGKLVPQNTTTVLNAIEMSLKQGGSNIVTYNNLNQRKDLKYLEDITRCLGLKSLDDVDTTATVNDVVTSDFQVEVLKQKLHSFYGINSTIDKLKQMSICSIKSFSKQFVKKYNKIDSKLGAFYTFVDQDEYMATNIMVPMKTVVRNTVEDNQLDGKATHLLMIPGFEGHHNVFKVLCENLKVQAMTIQLAPDLATESIKDMAKHIVKMLKKSFEFKSKFHLLGYSFGVNVALEVAALLEEEGHIGAVLCLDSSPNALRVQVNAYTGNQTESQLQNSIIEHIFYLMSGQKSNELLEDIDKLSDWTEKIDVSIKKLKHLVTYSHQYMRNVFDSAYKKFLLAKDYNPNIRLKSEIILIKGVPHPKSGNLASDYGLSEYTTKQVRVFNIASDHATAPNDCRVSSIVNKFMDPLILEDYKKNLCCSYKLSNMS